MNASNNNNRPVFFTVVRVSNILIDNYNEARLERDRAFSAWHDAPPGPAKDAAGKEYDRLQRATESRAASLACAAADPHQVVTRE